MFWLWLKGWLKDSIYNRQLWLRWTMVTQKLNSVAMVTTSESGPSLPNPPECPSIMGNCANVVFGSVIQQLNKLLELFRQRNQAPLGSQFSMGAPPVLQRFRMVSSSFGQPSPCVCLGNDVHVETAKMQNQKQSCYWCTGRILWNYLWYQSEQRNKKQCSMYSEIFSCGPTGNRRDWLHPHRTFFRGIVCTELPWGNDAARFAVKMHSNA